MSRTIRFYFDYISSNAYLAWRALPDLVKKYDATVEPQPVLFAGLLEAYGQLGPAEIGPKGLWMWRNNLRKAALLDVPLTPPLHHPFNPLLALRVSSLPLPKTQRLELISALFTAVWERRLHVSDEDVVRSIADTIGLPGADLVAAAGATQAKEQLRRQTGDALERGVFGVPTLIVDGELFWGYDDLRCLELFLAGEDPLDPHELSKWKGRVSPSAVRRRFRSRDAR